MISFGFTLTHNEERSLGLFDSVAPNPDTEINSLVCGSHFS